MKESLLERSGVLERETGGKLKKGRYPSGLAYGLTSVHPWHLQDEAVWTGRSVE